jgi:nicotinate-nucleotide adenylyltransferase
MALTRIMTEPVTLPPESTWLQLPLTAPGLRVGLLGGSFNPAHDGHRHISLEALARLNLDRVWWIVSPGNPLKSHAELAAQETRLHLAAAVAHHPRIDVTGFEAQLGTSYSAETLAFLKRRAPEVHFVWLMGADNLAALHHWRHWRRILATMPVAVLDRPHWRYRALASPAAISHRDSQLPESESRLLSQMTAPSWSFLSIPLSNLSSTALRARSRARPLPKRTQTPQS